MKSPSFTQAGVADATFGMRAAALLIDSFLLALLVLVFFIISIIVFLGALPPDLRSIITLTCVSLFLLLLTPGFIIMAYFTFFHAWGGQTVGKLIMGIRVVSTGLEQISPGLAFLRWTGYLVSAVPLAAGFLWAVLDKDHSAWHDKLAETRVIIV